MIRRGADAALPEAFDPGSEGWAALCWALSGLGAAAWMLIAGASAAGLWGALGLSLVLGGLRLGQAVGRSRLRARLAGTPVQPLPARALARSRDRGHLSRDDAWLGWGFRWEPRHARLAAEMLKRDAREIYPPRWVLRLLHGGARRPDPASSRGLPWIHGLDEERDIVLPFKALEGHTAIMAITGAIKTTLFKLLVYQIASRGDVVIVIDPKGDADLRAICRQVPQALGHPERFVMFHPAFPAHSFRFDAFSAWDRETQVASRIRMIMNTEEDNNFVSFVWMTVTHIVGCMKAIGQRASIAALLEHVQSQGAAELLCERVLERFLGERTPGFEVLIAERARAAAADPRRQRGKGSQVANPRLSAMIDYFNGEVEQTLRPREITGLIAAIEANREWFGKMIVTLTPTLTKLAAGDLGPLLSPNYNDIDDPRPILNSRKIIDGGCVAYFGLDALSDPSVAASIAAVTLADLAGTAGDIYNHASGQEARAPGRRVHVLIDEWGDAVCEPVIQIANKARGAGVVLYLAGQTFSDLVVKLGGNVSMAKRVMGNMNNLIVGATNDPDTLDMISAKIGETTVARVSQSQSTGRSSEDGGVQYRLGRGASVAETTQELVPRNVLMALPDLQYFAVVNRATLYKGRIPVLEL